MKRIKYVLPLVFILFSLSLVNAKETIVFPKEQVPNHAASKNAENFAKRVKELSNGELNIRVYPGASLYNREVGLRLMTQGSVHIMNPPNSLYVSYSKLFELIEIPFIFSSNEKFYDFLYGEEGELILKTLEKSNIKGITYMDEGPFIIATKDRLLKKPEDFKGLKIRTSGHVLMSNALRMLGASTVKITLGEVYSAAQQGVVNGIATTLEAYKERGLYEVLPYVTVWPGRATYVWTASKLWWEKLQPRNRFIIDTIAKEKAIEFNNYIANEADLIVEELKNKYGVKYYVLNTEENEKMKEALKPLYDEIIREYGDLAKEIIKKYGKN